ncbi:TetR/AcrR family transcriptional regulator [Pseudonocardia spinosispora]|uniref:TetR/AcrR family transcriptional regulator n=1 Tax=Pseudonocardia spinosispora TaxID=103441 RepID=UPI000402F13B|nr:TetR/AcrR family transcriptional regulator [Pseudonocardia spinosispora]
MGSAAPDDGRVRRGRDTRARLIASARAHFGESGFDATSIEAILESTGVARGALYHHFTNKTALFDAVLDQVTVELAEQVREAALGHSDPAGMLRAGCLAWLRCTADPAIQRIVLLDAPSVVGWTRWRQIDEQHTLGATKAVLRELARTGRFPVDTADTLAHLVLAAVGEAAQLIARAEQPEAALPDAQVALEILLDRLLEN